MLIVFVGIGAWGSAALEVTPLIADVALGGGGLAAFATAARAWVVRRRRLGLPLELSPELARVQRDGGFQYQIRARLGDGRPLRDPHVQARWVPTEGEPSALPAVVPATLVWGPFTAVVLDPDGVVGPDGVLEIHLRGSSQGRTWEASRRYDTASVREGPFGGPVRPHPRRGVVFEPEWATVRAPEARQS